MQDSERELSRRNFLSGVIVLPALAGLFLTQTSPAQAKGSQAQFKYQKTPKNGQKCSGCSQFVPGKSATADGTCKVVDGTISPNGWCIAWSKKT
ncbi:MAG TPA: high-potential iron-sulfur protein [Candidatus Cybelea sp.]|jgi:hypothetical protein